MSTFLDSVRKASANKQANATQTGQQKVATLDAKRGLSRIQSHATSGSAGLEANYNKSQQDLSTSADFMNEQFKADGVISHGVNLASIFTDAVTIGREAATLAGRYDSASNTGYHPTIEQAEAYATGKKLDQELDTLNQYIGAWGLGTPQSKALQEQRMSVYDKQFKNNEILDEMVGYTSTGSIASVGHESMSVRQLLDERTRSQDNAMAISDAMKFTIDTREMGKVTSAASEAWEESGSESWDKMVTGFSDKGSTLDGLMGMGGVLGSAAMSAGDVAMAAMENPTGGLQLAAQLIGSTVGALVAPQATLPGIATSAYNSAVEDFQRKYGRMPVTEEELARLTIMSAGSGAVDFAGDRLMGSVLSRTGAVRRAMDAEDLGSKAFMAVGSAIGEGYVAEGGAALLGDLASGDLSTVDGKAVNEAIAVGLVGGTGMSSPSLISPTLDAIGKASSKLTQAKKPESFPQDSQVMTNPDYVGSLLNEYKQAMTSDKSTPEEKNAAASKAFAIMNSVKLQADLTNQELAEEKANPVLEEPALKSVEARGKKLDNLVKQFGDGFTSTVKAIPKPELATIIAQFKLEDAEGLTKTMRVDYAQLGQKVLQQIALDPTSVSTEDMDSLIGSGKLTETQTEILKVNKAINAITTSTEVNQEVLVGGVNTTTGKYNKGIQDYQKNITQAMNQGNTTLAKQELAALTKFATSHNLKVSELQAAQVKSLATGSDVTIPRSQLTGQPFTVFADGRSSGIINTITNEAKALSEARTQLEGLVARVAPEDVQGTPKPKGSSPRGWIAKETLTAEGRHGPSTITVYGTPDTTTGKSIVTVTEYTKKDGSIGRGTPQYKSDTQLVKAQESWAEKGYVSTPVDSTPAPEVTPKPVGVQETPLVTPVDNTPPITTTEIDPTVPSTDVGSEISQPAEVIPAVDKAIPSVGAITKPVVTKVVKGTDVLTPVEVASTITQGDFTRITGELQGEVTPAALLSTLQAEPSISPSTLESITQEVSTLGDTLTAKQVKTILGKHVTKVPSTLDTLASTPVAEDADVDTKHEAENQVRNNYKDTDYSKAEVANPVATHGKDVFKVLNSATDEDANKIIGHKLSPTDKTMLRTTYSLVNKLKDKFNSVVAVPSQEQLKYRHTKVYQYLMDDNGVVPDKYLTAMGLVLADWIANRSQETETNSNEAINAFVGRDSKSEVTYEEGQALRNIGFLREALVIDWGKAALKAMGIKANLDADVLFTAKMELAVGTTMLAALIDSKMVEENTVTIEELSALSEGMSGHLTGQYRDATKTGVRWIDTNAGVANLRTLAESSDLLSKLTGSQFDRAKPIIGTVPRDKPVKSTLVKNGGGQLAPTDHVKSLNAYQKTAYTINKAYYDIAEAIGEKLWKSIDGFREDLSLVNIVHRDSIEGKNATINYAYKAFMGMKQRLTNEKGQGLFDTDIHETKFYYESEIINGLRIAMSSREHNPQSSKMDRFSIDSEVFGYDMNNSSTHYPFLMAVAQGLGIKVDKNAVIQSIADLHTEIGKYAPALAAIKKQLAGDTLTDADKQAIAQGAIDGSEAYHSLRSLTEYARYENALEAKDKEFQSALMYEADGKTCGPHFYSMQTALSPTNNTSNLELSARGGMFSSEFNSNADVANTFKDNYVTAGAKATEAMQSIVKQWNSFVSMGADYKTNKDGFFAKMKLDKLSHVAALVGKLEWNPEEGTIEYHRNDAKSPVTVTFYGASSNSIMEKMAGASIQAFHSDLTTFAEMLASKDPVQIQEAIKGLNEKFNHLRKAVYVKGGFDTPAYTVEGLVNWKMSASVQKAFTTSVKDTVGAGMVQGINQTFSRQIYATKTLTAAMNIVHELFVPKFDTAVRAKVAELRKEGKLSSYSWLSQQQYNEIKDSLLRDMPIINSFFTRGQGDQSLEQGLLLSNFSKTTKTATSSNEQASAAAQVQKFTNLKGASGIGGTYVGLPTWEAPGAGVVPKANIASSDVPVISLLAKRAAEQGNPFMQVYDGVLSAGTSVDETTHLLNQATYEVIKDYNLMGEINNTFMRGIESLTSDSEYTDYDATAMDAHLVRFFGKKYLEAYGSQEAAIRVLGEQLNKATVIAAQGKAALLSSDIEIQQFVGIGEGGIYSVRDGKPTGEVRKFGEESIAKEEAIFGKITATAIKPTETVDEANQRVANKKAKEAAEKVPVEEDYTKTAHNEGYVDQALQSALESAVGQDGYIDPAKALEALDAMQDVSPETKYHIELLRSILPAIEAMGTKIKLKEADTTYNYAGFTSTDNRGITLPPNIEHDVDPNYNGRLVVLNKIGSYVSGMSTETLVHELLHAALGGAMYLYSIGQNMSNNPARQKAMVKSVQTLMQLRNQVVKSGLVNQLLDAGHTQAAQDLIAAVNQDTVANKGMKNTPDEFVSWALTNMGILNQLGQVTSEVSTGKVASFITKVVTAMKNLLGVKSGSVIAEIAKSAIKLSEFVAKEQGYTQGKPLAQTITDQVVQFTPSEVFDSVTNNGAVPSAKQATVLKTLLTSIVDKAVDPLKLVFPTTYKVGSEDQLLLDAIDPEIDNASSAAFVHGFDMSEQEAYVFRLYKTLMDSNLRDFKQNIKELQLSFKLAKENLTWKNFVFEDTTGYGSDLMDQVKLDAQARYDSVFTVRVSKIASKTGSYVPTTYHTQESDYLSNFATLAATNEQFGLALGGLDLTYLKQAKTPIQNILEVFDNVIGFITEGYISTPKVASLHKKVNLLAKSLFNIEGKQKSSLISNLMETMAPKVTKLGDSILGATIDGVKWLAETKVARAVPVVSALASSVRAVIAVNENEGVQEHVADKFIKFNKDLYKGKFKFVGEVLSDFAGGDKTNAKTLAYMLKGKREVENARSTEKASIVKLVREVFSTPLTKDQSKAITKTVLKGDLTGLYERGYSVNRIHQMLTDSVERTLRVNTLVDRVSKLSPNVLNYLRNGVVGMAQLMIQGTHTRKGNIFTNVEAMVVGLPASHKVTEAQKADLLPLLDEWVSLVSVSYMKPSDIKAMSEVMSTQEGAVEAVMKLHADAKRNAKANTFKGSELLMAKGYVPEQYNPNRSTLQAPLGDRVQLERQGYTFVSELVKDSSDPSTEVLGFFVHSSLGNITYQQGAMGLIQDAMAGRSILDNRVVQGVKVPVAVAQADVQKVGTQKAAEDLAILSGKSDGVGYGSTLSPVVNHTGEIVNYRYTLSEGVKENYLDRDQDVATTLGTYISRIQEKTSTPIHNAELVKELRRSFLDDQANHNTYHYMTVGPKATDPELVSIWNMIPYSTKQVIEEVWGKGEGISVPADLIKPMFGYRQKSIANWFKEADRSKVGKAIYDKAVVPILAQAFGPSLARFLIRGEQGWQEMVAFVKDIIVIRGIEVMGANIISNTLQLVAEGVSLPRAIQAQLKYAIAGKEYMKNAHRIRELEHSLSAGLITSTAELIQLRDTQARSPVADLMEQGLVQSVIEDVDIQSSYSYSSGWRDKVDQFREDHLHPSVVKTLDWIFVTKGSTPHQFLTTVTQLSDFAARATLVEYRTTTKNKMDKQSSEAAIESAITTFINYDLTFSRGLDYANRMGMLRFMKYFMRIQGVLMSLLRRKFMRTMMLSMGTDILGLDVPMVTDSGISLDGLANRVGGIGSMIDGIGMHPINQIVF